MTRAKQREATAALAMQMQALQAQRRPEPASKASPVQCDCLNWCGDDPWIEDGRAKKCANYERLHPPKCHHCRGTGYLERDSNDA